jgi:hypothetical protein
MAIKIGGTTVVGDTRALQNIATVDSTTATSIEAAGVGGSTTVGGIRSYAWLGRNTAGIITSGSTYAGSGLKYAGTQSTSNYSDSTAMHIGGNTPSGTWRAMGNANATASRHSSTLFLRIS